jgi:branched-chain amino acid transport system substrate-binding protein
MPPVTAAFWFIEGGNAVGMKLGLRRFRSALALIAFAVVLSVTVAACGDSNNNGGGSTAGEKTTAAKCGLKNGKKATGSPIKLGGIFTKQPGTDFSEIGLTAKAYFQCVNDNGGINGHRIDYTVETEQTDPAQVASLAKKLVENDKVLGIVGNISLIECAVNHKYWESKGIYTIGAGIAPECWSTPNSAPVNMGPRYSVDGGTQYLIRQKVKKLVLVQSNVPGTGYIEGGFLLLGKDAGIPTVSLKENVPIQDANSVALKAVQAAGNGGGVVLNFTPPEALKILQAAQQQGLQKRVKWSCSTPCNTDFIAKALGPEWENQLGVNAELNVTSANDPDSQLYRAILKKYAPKIPLGSFSQMGFVQGSVATQALLGIKGPYTIKSVNEAFKNVKNFKTGILCRPYYYGDAPLHIPNHTDYTTTPKNGVMTIKEDCFDISNVDPDVKRVEDIEAKDPSLVGK